MSNLFIDRKAIRLLKDALVKENADAVRIFTSGGCCMRFEIMPVKKALAGDVTYRQDGIIVYIEKYIADKDIEIRFDEGKGLQVSFK